MKVGHCTVVTCLLFQAEQDAGSKDKELTEALERMRQYEAVSIFSLWHLYIVVQKYSSGVLTHTKLKPIIESPCHM